MSYFPTVSSILGVSFDKRFNTFLESEGHTELPIHFHLTSVIKVFIKLL